MTINRRHDDFGLSASTIHLPRSLACKRSLKAVMKKLIPNMIGPQTPTSDKVLILVIGKWTNLVYKMLIVLCMMHGRACCPRVNSSNLRLNTLMCQHFQKGKIYKTSSLEIPPTTGLLFFYKDI